MLRLASGDMATMHVLGDNIQYAKSAVLLPFQDHLERSKLNSTANSGAAPGTASATSIRTNNILFDSYLKPYFHEKHLPVAIHNIIPIQKQIDEEEKESTSSPFIAGKSSNKREDRVMVDKEDSIVDFKVMSIIDQKGQDAPFAIIGPDTELIFEGETLDRNQEDTRAMDATAIASVSHLKYNFIGGYEKQIRQIKEFLELPLRFPELFKTIGVSPPKGILLHGPSGSGKTLLAKTLAAETDAHIVNINGPELMSKISGESEANLRKAFEEASKHAPSVIIIDEIDAIAPKRDKPGGGGAGEVERRLVSQLITLMDDLNSNVPNIKNTEKSNDMVNGIGNNNNSNGYVIVVAATSRPNNIDSSLRRFGRFEKEIHLNVPDEPGRQDILRIKTGGMKLDTSGGDETVDLDAIGKDTHGFVGADIAQLCNEAGFDLIHNHAAPVVLSEGHELEINSGINSDSTVDERTITTGTGIDTITKSPSAPSKVSNNAILTLNAKGDESLSSDFLKSLAVSKRNFKKALKTTNPTSLRENAVEIPNVSWDDIGGLQHVKQELYETIQYPLLHGPLYEKFGLSPSRGVLFYGPPGCGKTLLAKAVANECGANFISIKGPELLTMWFGESEANVRDLFDKARTAAPCIIFFDEIDSLAKMRSNTAFGGGSEAADRVINQILAEIDGIGASNNKNLFIIGATNRPDVLDPAITRPGRLDQLIYIPLPDAATRLNILEANLRKTPLEEDVNLTQFVNLTEGFSGADLTELCQRAVKIAIGELVVMQQQKEKLKHFEPVEEVRRDVKEDPKSNIGATAYVKEVNAAPVRLRQEHLMEAMTHARRSVNNADMIKYVEFADRMKVNIPETSMQEELKQSLLSASSDSKASMGGSNASVSFSPPAMNSELNKGWKSPLAPNAMSKKLEKQMQEDEKFPNFGLDDSN